ncbi:MAG: transposase [Candidatus Omnitrophica bacterium]|nr:transposase [Candidatus Omnitrophota bacterium]
MVRQIRLQEEGATYHVYCRGNNKVKIFYATDDYRKFKRNLTRYKSKYGFRLYAYALMVNHIHLLVEPKEIDGLPAIMKSLNVSYSIWHNRRYDCVGHVWQGRYNSKIIKDERSFLTCMGYIEMNPVRAGIVVEPASYKWSSCYERFHRVRDPIIDIYSLFNEIGRTNQERRSAYYDIMLKRNL